MQTPQPIPGSRYLLLHPAAMATALAVIAFLKGLFAWPILLLTHGHTRGWKERTPGAEAPGAMPGGVPGAMPPGGMGGFHGDMHGIMAHHFMGQFPVWAFPVFWIAGIGIAAIAGALLAVIYNAVVARMERSTLKA